MQHASGSTAKQATPAGSHAHPPNLVAEFEGMPMLEEIRACADAILSKYDEAPVRSCSALKRRALNRRKGLQTKAFTLYRVTPPYPQLSTDNANRRFAGLFKPSDGLEPSTPSLPWRCSTS